MRETYMRMALALAEEAGAAGEIPVGCVIVRDGQVVGRGRNRREEKGSALSHAEVEAIAQANAALGDWRLEDCELYVTLEPCPMCAGAIINSRLRRVVYGAADPKAGCCGSVTDLFALPFNHRPAVERGLRAAEASALLEAFFVRLRAERGKRPKWRKPSAPSGGDL